MKIILFVNNMVGYWIAQYLISEKENIIGMVLHSPPKRKYGGQLLTLAYENDIPVFNGARLSTIAIQKLNPDIGISAYYGYILKKGMIDIFPKGVINLHPSLLPLNRGAHPNVWTIMNQTLAGVTIHYIDEGIDTGDLIAQKEIVCDWTDTGETLYKRLEIACHSLFMDTWPNIKAGKVGVGLPQPNKDSLPNTKECLKLTDEIYLTQKYQAEVLINQIRARTFPPHRGCFFLTPDGRKVFITVNLEYEEM